MKLSEETQNIIKNFSTINKSILFKEGNTITTISPSKSIYATAKISEELPKRCAIYELNRFLGAYSLFQEPDLEFRETDMVISDGRHKIKYTYANENTIVAPPEKVIKIPSEDITFKLSASEFQALIKAASVLSLRHVVVSNTEDEGFEVSAKDAKNQDSDKYTASVTEYSTDLDSFNVVFSVENLVKLLSRDYNVTICSAGVSKFEHSDVTYYVALEGDSTFS